MFAKVQIKNGNIVLLLSNLFVSSSMKENQELTFSQNFPALVICKTSKFATKETLFIIAQNSVALTKTAN